MERRSRLKEGAIVGLLLSICDGRGRRRGNEGWKGTWADGGNIRARRDVSEEYREGRHKRRGASGEWEAGGVGKTERGRCDWLQRREDEWLNYFINIR